MTATPLNEDDSAFRPRLFDPEAEPPEHPPRPSPGMTLQQYYERAIAPHAGSLSPCTLGEHRQALHRWQQFCDHPEGAKKDRRPHPVLFSISTDLIRKFSNWLVQTPHSDKLGNVRPATAFSANKSVQYIRGWLRSASEEDLTTNPGPVKKHRVMPGDHRIEIPTPHIDAIMHACTVAQWPTRWMIRRPNGEIRRPPIDPALFWRFNLVWLFIFGQRRGDVVGLKRENRPHTWANVIDDPENPHPNGRAICPDGWLVFEQSKTSKGLFLPINSVARGWLSAIAATHPERLPTDPILPLPRSKDLFYREFAAIVQAAGVAPKPNLELVDGVPQRTHRRYQLKNLRSTAASVIEEHASVGRLVTGHASDAERMPNAKESSDVFVTNYLSPDRKLVKSLRTLPMPMTFSQLLPTADGSPKRAV